MRWYCVKPNQTTLNFFRQRSQNETLSLVFLNSVLPSCQSYIFLDSLFPLSSTADKVSYFTLSSKFLETLISVSHCFSSEVLHQASVRVLS